MKKLASDKSNDILYCTQVADDIFAKIKRDLEECRKTGKIPTFSEKPSTGEGKNIFVIIVAVSNWGKFNPHIYWSF